jgi:molybdate transport system ATP-binding protein
MLKANIYKQIGDFLLEVDVTVGNRELLVILGASGCGKSTLLNCLAGFLTIDQGYIELDKVVCNDTKGQVHLPINKRHIAYIQQGKTLFPHLTVKENILYSIAKKQRQPVEEAYRDLLQLLGIEDLESRMPHSLSGGQQQRVAIARSLMMSPKLILWDEPFSALDHMIREELRDLVLSLKRRLSIPMIFVTHDLEEAFQLADRLGVMDQGKILQLDDRDRLFNSPINHRVGKVLGISNILETTYVGRSDHQGIKGDLVTLKCQNLELKGIDIDKRLLAHDFGSRVNIGIRPEQILYVRQGKDDQEPLAQNVEGNVFEATVFSITKHLENYRLKIGIKGLETPLLMDIPRGVIQRYDIYEGGLIKVLLKYKRIILMDPIGPSGNGIEGPNPASKDFVVGRGDQVLNRYQAIAHKGQVPVVGIAGLSNSGKTKVVTEIVEELASRGYRVGTIKHDGHGFEIDQPGKDTYKHRQAGARSVVIASRDKYALIKETPDEEVSLEALIKVQEDVDIVIVEGYKFSRVPKFEVIREASSTEGVCRQDTLMGHITDMIMEDRTLPTYGFDELSDLVAVLEKIIKETSYEG